jgi:hypothetical protein
MVSDGAATGGGGDMSGRKLVHVIYMGVGEEKNCRMASSQWASPKGQRSGRDPASSRVVSGGR